MLSYRHNKDMNIKHRPETSIKIAIGLLLLGALAIGLAARGLDRLIENQALRGDVLGGYQPPRTLVKVYLDPAPTRTPQNPCKENIKA